MGERERESERQRQRQTDRQTETDRQTQTDRQTDRQTDIQGRTRTERYGFGLSMVGRNTKKIGKITKTVKTN